MKQYWLIGVAFVVFSSCTDSCSNPEALSAQSKNHKEVKLKEPFYEVVIEDVHMNKYGYKILKDGEMIINQMNIPAIQGNAGFNSEEDATKTGELMLNKIKNGVFPPTISKEELDSLGVLN